MAHGPARLGVREMYRHQIGADRHFGLLPLFTRIVADQHVPALTHRHDALAGPAQAGDDAARRERALLCGRVQHVAPG